MAADSPTGKIKRKAINGGTGDTTLVAAVTGRKIRVVAITVAVSAPTNLQLKDDAGTPNLLTGAVPCTTGAPLQLLEAKNGWGETAAGQLLRLNSSDATATWAGVVIYQEVK